MRRLLSFLNDMFRRSPHGAGVPAQRFRAPVTGPSVQLPVPGQVIERIVERQVIPGSPVGFAVSYEVRLGDEGSLDQTKTVLGVVGGDGQLITDYEHLGGRCPFCQAEAHKRLARGEIDVHTAHCQSLYSKESRATCNACRQDTCKRHALQAQQADGSVIYLCPLCMEEHQKARLVQRVLGIVLWPFVSVSQPEQERGSSNDTT